MAVSDTYLVVIDNKSCMGCSSSSVKMDFSVDSVKYFFILVVWIKIGMGNQ